MRNRNKVERVCQGCKKTFLSPTPTVKRPCLYCSKPCYHNHQARPMIERFWEKVDKSDPSGCWRWTGATHQYGYGRMLADRRRVVEAHRLSWEIHFGPIPAGLHVCHRCDNPICCNPAHLFLGTNNDNRQDSVRKKRHAYGDRTGFRRHPELVKRGEDHPSSVLSEDQVREIRQRRARGETMASLARQYGVSYGAIQGIVERANWKHIT